VQKLLTAPKCIYSYSNPTIFDSQAKRSAQQISGWHNLQESLLAISSKLRLPTLLLVDVQNCYHTLYTHTIEWAYESIKEKSFGSDLDKSIRRGNDNRTHGLPVGQYTTDILAESVLTWVDAKLEKRLKDVECVGLRFKDNYYILCKNAHDAEIALSATANELRQSHFVINDSKTVVCQFAEYYSSKWQSEYDLLLESLNLEGDHPVLTNRKLKVLLEQVIQLSNKYNNEKAIMEKAIDLITNCAVSGKIGYRWLFYTVTNMLPLRSMSYPKLLAYLKKIVYLNPKLLGAEYRGFMINEIEHASESEDLFTLLWLGYLLHDSEDIELKELILSELIAYEDESLMAAEMNCYILDSPTVPLLWKTNTSRLEFQYEEYKNVDELCEHLGVSFGES
jgi:hypothetical protein